MRPIISIVGKSNSGKTTLLEALIAELRRRGRRVVVIKHSGENVELDTVNKDTWRFSRAGSEVSAISSGQRLAFFKNLEQDATPEEIGRFICLDYDLILTEGFKRGKYPKIEVHRQEQGSDLVSPVNELIAVVTDEPLQVNVPQFSRDATKEIADLIEDILDQRKEDDFELLVNGTYISPDSATRNLLTRKLISLIRGLNGIKDVKSLHISFRRKA